MRTRAQKLEVFKAFLRRRWFYQRALEKANRVHITFSLGGRVISVTIEIGYTKDPKK